MHLASQNSSRQMDLLIHLYSPLFMAGEARHDWTNRIPAKMADLVESRKSQRTRRVSLINSQMKLENCVSRFQTRAPETNTLKREFTRRNREHTLDTEPPNHLKLRANRRHPSPGGLQGRLRMAASPGNRTFAACARTKLQADESGP